MLDIATVAKNISGYIVAFIVLGSWSGVNYQKQSELFDKLAEFEKYKTVESAKIRDKDLALDKEKLRLESFGKQVEDMKTKSSATEETAVIKLRLAAEKEQQAVQAMQLISPSVQQAQEDIQIRQLMDKFSSLGVNLSYLPPCNDSNAQTKFNQAKATMSQIINQARTAGLLKKYADFIQSNVSSSVFVADCK